MKGHGTAALVALLCFLAALLAALFATAGSLLRLPFSLHLLVLSWGDVVLGLLLGSLRGEKQQHRKVKEGRGKGGIRKDNSPCSCFCLHGWPASERGSPHHRHPHG